MADEKTPAEGGQAPQQGNRLGQPQRLDVETQSSSTEAMSLDLSMEGLEPGENRHGVQNAEDGVVAEVGMGDQDTLSRENVNKGAQQDKPEGDQQDDQQEQPDGAAAPLPEYDASKPEVETAYTERYLTNGAPDISKVSTDWKPTFDEKGNVVGGTLPESTYKFLEAKGFDKATVKSVEAGQIALIQAQYTRTFALAGGETEYREAQAFAKQNWSAEKKKVFNEDRMAGGVREANAIALLMTDYKRANKGDRRTGPTRTAGANAGAGPAGGGGVEPYATKADWQKDVRKARETNDQALLNTTRARAKVSPWYAGG